MTNTAKIVVFVLAAMSVAPPAFALDQGRHVRPVKTGAELNVRQRLYDSAVTPEAPPATGFGDGNSANMANIGR